MSKRLMKDSGISFLGVIPEQWTIKRTRFIATSLEKGNGITKEEVYPDGDISCVRYGEIYTKYNNGFTSCVSKTKLEQISKPSYFSHGDLLFCGTGELVEEIGKNVVYLGYDKCLAGGDIIIMKHEQNPKFINYALNSSCSQAQKSYGKAKLKVVHISASEIGNIWLALPLADEQARIADFLDKKVSEIDAIISKTKESIEEYKKLKQSIITEAVTKGLNPNAEMKDSGVEFIGQIPKTWQVRKTKRLVTDHLQGYYDNNGYVEQGYKLLRITDLMGEGRISVVKSPFVEVREEAESFLLEKGDFCFARTGGAGTFGFVSEDIEPTVFASYLIRFRFSGINNNFLKYTFLSSAFIEEINSLIHGSVNQNVHAENIKDTHVLIPTIVEQEQIVSFLDDQCSKFNNLISKKEQVLSELEQYKKSLIYEYVTGKKEVA